jgi:hypothetical protein
MSANQSSQRPTVDHSRWFDFWLPIWIMLIGSVIGVVQSYVTSKQKEKLYEQVAIAVRNTNPSIQSAKVEFWDVVLDSLPKLMFWGVGARLLSVAIYKCRKSYEDRVLDDLKLTHRATLDETWGLLLPGAEQLVKVDKLTLPPLFESFLIKERRWQQDGIVRLREQGQWPITTADNYEFIGYVLPKATNVDILDQDIRRWFEVLGDGNPQTSTTFNYSNEILCTIFKTLVAKDSSVDKIRRVFAIWSPEIPCFTDADMNKIVSSNFGFDAVWVDLSKATRVLLLLWGVEAIFNRPSRQGGPKCETRFRNFSRNESATPLFKSTLSCQDFVMIDYNLCSVEEFHFEKQSSRNSSFQTESHLAIFGHERSKEKMEFRKRAFSELWNDQKTKMFLTQFKQQGSSEKADLAFILDKLCRCQIVDELSKSLQ